MAQFLEMDSLEPLSNFALRVALFVHLQKLVYKEPNLKELVVKEVKRTNLYYCLLLASTGWVR